MKRLSLMAASLALTGCMTMDELTPDTTMDRSFYRLNGNSSMLCQGESNDCRDLTLLASSEHLTEKLEELYQHTITHPNRTRGLMLMLLQPGDKAYTAAPISGAKYQYRLPKTERTDTLWRALEAAHNEQYGSSPR